MQTRLTTQHVDWEKGEDSGSLLKIVRHYEQQTNITMTWCTMTQQYHRLMVILKWQLHVLVVARRTCMYSHMSSSSTPDVLQTHSMCVHGEWACEGVSTKMNNSCG